MTFIIQKLKSKHTSLKKYTNWAKLIYFSLVLRERVEKKPKYFAPKYLLTQWYKLNWNVTNVISHSNHHFICINILNKFMESHQFCQKQINVFCAQPLLQGFALFHSWPHPLEKRFLNTIFCQKNNSTGLNLNFRRKWP